MLKLHDVTLKYGATLATRAVSLSLGVGELACLLGPSGCGKTTLLRAVAGLHPLSSGQILLRGEEVDGDGVRRPTEQRAIGMVFQDLALFPHLDVHRHLELALHRWPRPERPPRIQQLLEDFQLQDFAQRRPHELSGGQQQRVALARALAARTDLVLLDEPFSSLDAQLKAQMNRWLRQQLKRYGACALMVSHDQEEALVFADVVGVMHAGELLQWGTPREVYLRPGDRRVAQFLGESQLLAATRLSHGRYACALGEVVLDSDLADGWLVLRPEDLELVADADPSIAVQARVIHAEFRGSWTCYRLALLDGGGEVRAAGTANPGIADGAISGVRVRPGHARLLRDDTSDSFLQAHAPVIASAAKQSPPGPT